MLDPEIRPPANSPPWFPISILMLLPNFSHALVLLSMSSPSINLKRERVHYPLVITKRGTGKASISGWVFPWKPPFTGDFLMIFVCHVTFDSPRLIDTIPGVFLFNPHLLWDSGFRNQTETLQLFAKGMPPHQQRSPWLDADFRHAEIALALAKTSKMLFVDGKIVYLRRMRLSSAAGEERVFLRQALWGFTDHHSRSSAAPKKWIRICQQERILTKEQIA